MFKMVWDGLNFYTEGVNGFVDVKDVVTSMVKLMDSEVKNERFIISSENSSYKELFFSIADQLGKKRASKKAGKIISAIGWRASLILSYITGSTPIVTKETARTANKSYYYNNEKIKNLLKMDFISVNESVENTAQLFLRSV